MGCGVWRRWWLVDFRDSNCNIKYLPYVRIDFICSSPKSFTFTTKTYRMTQNMNDFAIERIKYSTLLKFSWANVCRLLKVKDLLTVHFGLKTQNEQDSNCNIKYLPYVRIDFICSSPKSFTFTIKTYLMKQNMNDFAIERIKYSTLLKFSWANVCRLLKVKDLLTVHFGLKTQNEQGTL
jgi:hypothetical protein